MIVRLLSKRAIQYGLISIWCALGSLSVYGQGTIDYVPIPDTSVAVPTIPDVGLVVLALLLGLAAYKLSLRHSRGSRIASLLLLSAGILLVSSKSSHWIDLAHAVFGGAPFDKPNGGQIQLGWGLESHQNTSGVPIKITLVTYNGVNAGPNNECKKDMVLPRNQSCNTDVEGTCGNGVIEAAEQCDDGNTADGDGCSAICTAEIASCNDGILNGTETDIDCGGPDCPACEVGRSCLVDADCASGICIDNVCEPLP